MKIIKWAWMCVFLLSACIKNQIPLDNQVTVAQKKEVVATKKIVPTYQEPSRYGNVSRYHVYGKTYQVLKNPNGYKARGVASWYGPRFHKKRTSSGEQYNMYAMTAAHKTLPLPSYIHVRNVENGKEQILKVNDRGPFHKARILDLSYAAAKALGVLKKGTALVEIESINVATEKKLKRHWYVQLGAFIKKEGALQLVQKLKEALGYNLQVEPQGNIFLVLLGPIDDFKQRLVLEERLVSLGVVNSFSFIKEELS